MRIAVAGGTGMVGQHVVTSAERAGHDVVSMSRGSGVDLTTGAGLAEHLAGVDAVVDVTNVPTLRRRAAERFFETATQNLLAAASSAGVRHIVALSIVGVDRTPSGYYQGKLRQEAVLAAGDVPWTVLRATQFHEFPGQLASRMSGPVVPVPRMRVATVAASEVADQLVSLASGEPIGRAPDMSGPEVQIMLTLMRRWFAASGIHRWAMPMVMPGAAGKAMATDGLLPTTPGITGRQTFDEWLSVHAPVS